MYINTYRYYMYIYTYIYVLYICTYIWVYMNIYYLQLSFFLTSQLSLSSYLTQKSDRIPEVRLTNRTDVTCLTALLTAGSHSVALLKK